MKVYYKILDIKFLVEIFRSYIEFYNFLYS